MQRYEDIENLPEKHKVVAGNIRIGKRNAITLDSIMILADIKNKRNAYIIIEELINRYGYVIGGSKSGRYKGYYIPADEREFQEVIKNFKLSVDSMKKRYNNLMINYNKEGA